MGSYPIPRSFDSTSRFHFALVAQSGERRLVRPEAAGSKPAKGAILKRVNQVGPETALNTDRPCKRLGFEYPALCQMYGE